MFKKIFEYLSMLMLLGLIGAAASQIFAPRPFAQTACVPPPPNIVAWLPGDGNTNDISGNNNNGNPSGVVYTSGKVGQAFRIGPDGGASVGVPPAPSLNFTNALTIEAWVNPATPNTSVSFTPIVDKGFGITGTDPTYILNLNPNTEQVSFGIGSPSQSTFAVSPSPIPRNTFTHVVGTYDGATVRIYINGVLADSQTTTISSLVANNNGLRIGQSPNFVNPFFGTIDEVTLYNRVLSPAEIQAIVAADSAGKCRPGAPTPTPTSTATPTPTVTPTPTPIPTPTATPTPSPSPSPSPSPGGNTCRPTTTVTEGDLAPGGIASFGVSSGFGSVTVDHVNAGTGLQSLTVVGTPMNAVVTIPPFTPGTFNPVTVTFTTPMAGQAVDFTLRAASSFHAAFVRVRCAETCTPTTTVTEGDLAPGGIVSFGVSSGAGSVTVDHVNAGTGLQSLTVAGTPTNAVVNIPAFTPGTTAPVVVTFSVIDPTMPVDFTLRAASRFHAANIRARCGTPPPREPEK